MSPSARHRTRRRGSLTEAERKHAAGLMRVNHAGEICAQALYEGQALTARDAQVRETLRTAAAEENDHLAWCRERLDELDGRPSVLDPVFYAASFALGAAVGVLGDKVSLGFVEATEDQVKRHLDLHIRDLPETDERSRAILEEMRADESRHGRRREAGRRCRVSRTGQGSHDPCFKVDDGVYLPDLRPVDRR